MISKVKSLLLALCIGGIAYYMDEPLPDGWKQPWKTRCIFACEKLSGIPAKVAGALGFETSSYITLGINAMLAAIQKTEHLDKVTEVREQQMAGVRTYVVSPKGAGEEPLPGMVYFHGGGWTVCDPDSLLNTVRRIVRDTQTVGVIVDYRLAPRHPFPAGLDDCVAVTKHVMAHGDQYGVDGGRVFLSGDSAGGHLSVTVAMKLQEEHFAVQPLFLAIFYPAFQAVDLQTPSYQANAHDRLLTTDFMAYFYANHAEGHLRNMASYANNKHVPKEVSDRLKSSFMPLDALPEDDFMKEHRLIEAPSEVPFWSRIRDTMLDPYFNPLFAPDEMLKGLPKVFMNFCHRDVLRDDALWFAARLQHANVSVEVDYAQCFHCWIYYSENLDSADELMYRMTDFVKRNL